MIVVVLQRSLSVLLRWRSLCSNFIPFPAQSEAAMLLCAGEAATRYVSAHPIILSVRPSVQPPPALQHSASVT